MTSTEPTTDPAPKGGTGGLYRLLAWMSPAFPTGGFSYSHGLEAAAQAGEVGDRTTLEIWVAAIVLRGSGRIDAAVLCAAYCAAAAGDGAGLEHANRRGIAYRATAELGLESAQQGAAFVTTRAAAWPQPAHLSPLPARGERECADASETPRPVYGEREGPAAKPWEGEGHCHAAAFGAAAARAGIALDDALLGWLQAFAANLVSAGLRLGIVGQTDGQRILAALEAPIARAAIAASECDPEDFGGATFAADLASMAHETQYTRLFRS